MRVIGSERIHIKQRCGNNHSVLQDVVEALRDWGHALSLWEREMRNKDSDIVVYRGKRLLKQLWCFKVADSLSSANCCFKAVLLRRLSNTPPPPPTSGLKGSCCTLISFLYCTFKHDSVSVICKTKTGDRQRTPSLRSVTYIFKKREKKTKNNRL